MAAVVGTISRHGLSIDAHHGNQPNKSKLALYKPLIQFSSGLKWLYISNKLKHFSYLVPVNMLEYFRNNREQKECWNNNYDNLIIL